MKRAAASSALACALMISLLVSACGGDVRSMKLSEMSNPDAQKQFLEELSQEERKLIAMYIATHGVAGDLDYNVTVGEAIKSQREASQQQEELQSARQRAASQVQ